MLFLPLLGGRGLELGSGALRLLGLVRGSAWALLRLDGTGALGRGLGLARRGLPLG
ncbi:MAG: hypothetical protein HFF30_08015, partial [Flavonifractor sp.]|nr:hypothetical protein [Flavonifractor sp.]